MTSEVPVPRPTRSPLVLFTVLATALLMLPGTPAEARGADRLADAVDELPRGVAPRVEDGEALLVIPSVAADTEATARGAVASTGLGDLAPDPPAGVGEVVEETCEHRVADGTPFGISACAGVAPGARIVGPQGGCTLGFAFEARSSTGTKRVFATAGHCILDAPGQQRTWASGQGPVIRDADNRTIARAIYARYGGGEDFALVELTPGVGSSARVCHFGGPSGVDRTLRSSSELVSFYGQASGARDTVPARSGYARTLDQSVLVRFDGPASFGDSGAPLLSADGRALALITSLGTDAPTDGIVRGVRLRHALPLAEQTLGVQLVLRTSSS